MGAGGGVVGEEEDAAGAGPELVERGFGFEDGGGVGPEGAVPEAVDAAVDEMDLLAGVEDEGGAGGEFAVEDDEVVGGRSRLLGACDGEGEVFGAEDGVEAGEAGMGCEQGDGHGCGEGKVGGVGASGAADEVAAETKEDHAYGNCGERAAEETHGGSGEVEEVAEGDVIEVGVLGEQAGEVGAGCGVGGGEGEVSADDGDGGGDGYEEDGGPAEDAAAGARVVGVGLGEESGGHEGKSGDGGEGVVLLAGGEGEEAKDEERP